MKMQKALHLHIELAKSSPKCIGKTYAIFEKYDGWYGYIDLTCHENYIKSSAGRDIPSLSDLSKIITNRIGHISGRLIFEIMIPGLAFSILNGVLNRRYEQAEDAIVICHDWIPTNDLNMPFHQRYKILKNIVRVADDNKIDIAPIIYQSNDICDWRETAEQVWAVGGEGVVLKRMDAMYSPGKRNCDLMKIKEELTVDLLVIGAVEGEGKYTGNLGALVLRDSKGGTHQVSGMTDAQRYRWWNNAKEIVGKVVEVKAMKWLPDGQLREPRFSHIRHDKTSSDID